MAVKFTVADYMDFAGASAHEAVLSKMLSHPNVVQVGLAGRGKFENVLNKITYRRITGGEGRAGEAHLASEVCGGEAQIREHRP